MNATTGLALLILITLPVTALGDLVPADHPFFESDQVQEIRLYFEQVDFWDILTENYEEEIYMEAGFEWEDYCFDTVGVRFKGGSSYNHNPTMKKSFKIDFDVFTPFQGNLNNQQTVTLDTSILASGVYILRLSQGQSVISTLVTVIK